MDGYQTLLSRISDFYQSHGRFPTRRDVTALATAIYRGEFEEYHIKTLGDACRQAFAKGLTLEDYDKQPKLDFSTKPKVRKLLLQLKQEKGGKLTTQDILQTYTGLSRIIFTENRWGVTNVYELCKLLYIELDGIIWYKYAGKQGFEVVKQPNTRLNHLKSFRISNYSTRESTGTRRDLYATKNRKKSK